jgi:hypothetical protein
LKTTVSFYFKAKLLRSEAQTAYRDRSIIGSDRRRQTLIIKISDLKTIKADLEETVTTD